MNKTAMNLHARTARALSGISLFLIVLFLLLGSGRHAGISVVLPLCISAGALAAIFVMAQRETMIGRRIDAAVKQTEARNEEQMAEVADELARSTHRHIDTLDSMIAGCQIIDFNWRYLYLNEAAAEHGKKPKHTLLGRTMMECYPGIESTALFTVLERSMRERTQEHIENEFVHNDGSRGWFELSIQPVPEGIFVVSIDMTERKLAEINMQ